MRKGYFNGELTEREIEVEKEIRRENTKEAIALIIAVSLFVLLYWLFLVATPDQMSAECEYLRYQMLQFAEEQEK